MTKYCGWRYDEAYYMYDTTCHKAWTFVDGKREENDVVFCPFCGGKITEWSEAIAQMEESHRVLAEWWGNTKMPVQYLSPYDHHWYDTTFPLAHILANMPIRKRPDGTATPH